MSDDGSITFANASSDFINAVTSGGDALTSLAAKADALRLDATDDQDVGIAEQARKFAVIAGPRWLQRAKDKGDASELQAMQDGLRGVTEDVTTALVDDTIERFLLMSLGGLFLGPYGVVAGALPPDVMDQIKTSVQSAPTPPAPQDLPWPVFIGAGAVAGAGLSFVNTGNPRVMIGGAVVGAALGAAAKYGLQYVADYFTLKHFTGGGST